MPFENIRTPSKNSPRRFKPSLPSINLWVHGVCPLPVLYLILFRRHHYWQTKITPLSSAMLRLLQDAMSWNIWREHDSHFSKRCRRNKYFSPFSHKSIYWMEPIDRVIAKRWMNRSLNGRRSYLNVDYLSSCQRNMRKIRREIWASSLLVYNGMRMIVSLFWPSNPSTDALCKDKTKLSYF